MALLTVKQYAKHRGCSERGVRKALESGRIRRTSERPACIDVVNADRDWMANTSEYHGGKRAKCAGDPCNVGLVTGSASGPDPVPGQVPKVFREMVEATATYYASDAACEADPKNLALNEASDADMERMNDAAARALDAVYRGCANGPTGGPNIYRNAPPAVRRLLDLFHEWDRLGYTDVGWHVRDLIVDWQRECVPAAVRECASSNL